MNDEALNYIWIQPGHIQPPRISESGLRVAVKANRHPAPGVDRFLWLDSTQGVEVPVKQVMQAHLEVRDLRTLKAYAEDPLFSAEQGKKEIIWHQVDMARILVLQHCLEDAGYKIAVYSDLDMKPAGGPRMQAIMDRYGMFFGARPYGRGDTILENQFIALSARHKDFIAEILLPEMRRTMAETTEPNGLSALYRALEKRFPELGGDLTPLTLPMIEKTASPSTKWHLPGHYNHG